MKLIKETLNINHLKKPYSYFSNRSEMNRHLDLDWKYYPERKLSRKQLNDLIFDVREFTEKTIKSNKFVFTFEQIMVDDEFQYFEVIFRKPLIDILRKNNILDWPKHPYEIMVYLDIGYSNRFHFTEGLPPFLKGTGLGYLIYKQFAHFAGYLSSDEKSSSSARKIWMKLLTKDPDFYALYIQDYSIIISKLKQYTNYEIRAIVRKFLDEKFNDKGIKLDPKKVHMSKELKKILSIYV